MEKKPQDKAKIGKLTQLVKASIGYNKKRGDIVTVVNTSFVQTHLLETKGPGIMDEPWFWDLIKKTVGISLGFIFLVVLYRKLSPELFKKRGLDDKHVSAAAAGSSNVVSPEMIRLKNEQIEILKELVAKDPNRVTGIIKKWVSK
jgi:flagellar M-ring protein FliF